jgi:hypothetical protein
MKQITPISIWSNGQSVQCDALNSYVTDDNLTSQATFYYGIGVIINGPTPTPLAINSLTYGRLEMTGADYTTYETNQQAWDWIAKQLNVTIIGDYPVPNPPITENIATPTIATV